MIRIVTYDSDTDEMIVNHLAGYIVCIHRDDDDPAGQGLGDFRIEGFEYEDDRPCYVVTPMLDADGDYIETGEPQCIPIDDVTVTIY